MAEVLAPIVQPATTMLHSSPDAFKSVSQSHQSSRPHPMPSSHIYNAQRGGIPYRGTSASPVAPYAFQTTPHLRLDNRTSSAPAPSSGLQQNFQPGHHSSRSGPASTSSASTASTASSSSASMTGRQVSKDDSMVPVGSSAMSRIDGRPASSFIHSTSVPDLSLQLTDSQSKTSADRYRRTLRRPETALLGETNHTDQSAVDAQSKDQLLLPSVFKPNLGSTNSPTAKHIRSGSADDTTQNNRQSGSELAKRYRRRSLGNLGNLEPALNSEPLVKPTSEVMSTASAPRPNITTATVSLRPASSRERTASSESRASVHSQIQRPASARNDSYNSSKPSMFAITPPQHQPRSGHRVPSDGGKRLAASPLAKPILADDESSSPSSSRPKTPEPSIATQTPAMRQLSALNEKELNKGMKSRLRRALSFSSAAELRKAAETNAAMAAAADRNKLRKDNREAEQEREDAIVAQQEAAGIGSSIYSGQGNVFTGSTDNLSISSTASSASMMLRKVGRGMKKSTRSLKAIFRPKSMVGGPTEDAGAAGTAGPSVAEVSMVTVEAEREQVNVHVDSYDHPVGGSGLLKLDTSSVDSSSIDPPSSSHGSVTGGDSRKTILGGDRERQQILAAVAKKGILKRPGSTNSSPVVSPADQKTAGFALPPVPYVGDSPASSAPGTPVEERIRLDGTDYFMAASRFATASSKSLPNTPGGSIRNITFSPRIQFHDVWSPTDYDRRGDIATCNKLTPMLAQQIKEELNTFKMEMEVHELSKPHTHFF